MLILPLIVPIVICTVVLFFSSFLSWMVLQLHRQDWVKLPDEDRVMAAVRDTGVAPGNYMFPSCDGPKEMQSEAFQAKYQAGPLGVITVFPGPSMGRNLALTVLYFFVTSVCIAYLAQLGLPPGAEFARVFRFVSTAGLMTFLSAIVQHAIWFRCRIVGHVIESIAYALTVGAIFAYFWPAA